MAASGDFVKCDFIDAVLNTRRLAPNVSKMFPLRFSHIPVNIANVYKRLVNL